MNKSIHFSSLLREVLIFLADFAQIVLKFNSSKLAALLRRKLYKTDCFIDTAVSIVNPRNFCAQKETALYHGCYILNTHGQFSMGLRSHLGAYCFVNAVYGNITIGDDVAIGPGTKIFAYSNHFERSSKVTDIRITKDITIGNNVFIGANSVILPGAFIHNNVIIGAGSVVKGELEANGIYGGIPCRLLRKAWYE